VRGSIAFSVELTIPDNEAYTALVTLVKLGVRARGLDRSEVWVFDADAAVAKALEPTIRGVETIFNPNKHVLRRLETPRPRPGELWVGEREEAAAAPSHREIVLAGRRLAGVYGFKRYKGWRLWESEGVPAASQTVAAASETLFCNSAFQEAIVCS
jgi:hypothetical protein